HKPSIRYIVGFQQTFSKLDTIISWLAFPVNLKISHRISGRMQSLHLSYSHSSDTVSSVRPAILRTPAPGPPAVSPALLPWRSACPLPDPACTQCRSSLSVQSTVYST